MRPRLAKTGQTWKIVLKNEGMHVFITARCARGKELGNTFVKMFYSATLL